MEIQIFVDEKQVIKFAWPKYTHALVFLAAQHTTTCLGVNCPCYWTKPCGVPGCYRAFDIGVSNPP